MQVIKRDGSSVDYDRSKIIIAIQKANAEVEDSEKISQEKIEAIVDGIESKHRMRMLVEDIQDIIEQRLMDEKKFALAKTYIIYRYSRALVRKANTTDDSILSLIKNSNKDVMEENSNKNAAVSYTHLFDLVKRIAYGKVEVINSLFELHLLCRVECKRRNHNVEHTFSHLHKIVKGFVITDVV